MKEELTRRRVEIGVHELMSNGTKKEIRARILRPDEVAAMAPVSKRFKNPLDQ